MKQAKTMLMNIHDKITADSILFFDMDGTLVDTDYSNFLSYKKAIELVKRTNFHIDYNPTQRLNRSLLKSIIPNLTEKELVMIISEKEKCYNDFLSETQLNNEIAEILDRYRKTNNTVLVTNCREDRALATLNYHRLIDKFNNSFFRQFGKDNRKINKFQNAISCLGISPKLVIAFENEEKEIANAKKAGIQYINPKI